MFEKRVLNIYSIIIGILFLISGIGKVIDTTQFSMLINQYGLGYFRIFSPLIVLIEILMGLFLVLLINPKRYAMISSVLLILFTVVFVYAHVEHGINDCGCFGSVQHTNLPPTFTFIRNFILIGMSLVLWITYPKEKIKVTKWKKYIIIIVMGVSIFTAGFTFQKSSFFKTEKITHRFQNQSIRNTALSNYIKTSSDSTYLVFCFSYTCPHCWNSIENLRQYKKNNTVDRIITFATGKTNNKLFFIRNFKPDFYIKDLSPNEMDKLTDLFPIAFFIKHDSIKAVIEGELPSHVIFENQYRKFSLK